MNQTCRTLLEKQGRNHKRCILMDPHTWLCKSRTTSTNIHSVAMWGYGMLSWRPARAMNDREEWWERVRDIRATSVTWWWWYIYIYIYIHIRLQGSLKKFPNFFRMSAFIDSTHMKLLSPSNHLPRLQCTCCAVPTTSGRPHESPLVWAC